MIPWWVRFSFHPLLSLLKRVSHTDEYFLATTHCTIWPANNAGLGQASNILDNPHCRLEEESQPCRSLAQGVCTKSQRRADRFSQNQDVATRGTSQTESQCCSETQAWRLSPYRSCPPPSPAVHTDGYAEPCVEPSTCQVRTSYEPGREF
jgi:hypothetical protein